MGKLVKGLITLLVLGALGVVLTWAYLEGRAERQREMERETPVAPPPRVAKGATGELIIKFDLETQHRIGLRTHTLTAAQHEPEIVAYGSLEADPAQSFTLRAPVAGIVEASADRPWPHIGQTIGERGAIGFVRPRLGPVERVDLSSRLLSQRATVDEIQASLVATRASYENKRRLNEKDGIVSDRTVEEAEARVKGEEARLQAAIETVRLIEQNLTSGGAGEPWPMSASRGGQVVQVAVQPGEVVEAGQAILQVQRFDELIARVGLPASYPFDKAPPVALIVALGQEHEPIDAEFLATSPSLEPKTLGQAMLFRVRQRDSKLRPGTAVKAYVPVPGEPLHGVVIPTEAVERYQGKAWAYVQSGDETFVRREAVRDRPVDGGWFMQTGFAPGDRVVVSGSQTLLSEEFKSQIQTLGEGEGK